MECEIFDYLIKLLKNVFYFKIKNEFEVSSLLIGFEVTFVAIIFTLLPFLVKDKKEIFLGYKWSDFILFEYKKNTKFKWFIRKILKKTKDYNDLMFMWLFNIIIILVSIILLMCKFYTIIYIVFLVFIIVFYIKVKEYLYLITTKEHKAIISKEFLTLLESSKDEAINKIKANKSNDVFENEETFSFILNNLGYKNMDTIYKIFSKDILQKDDDLHIYMYFNRVSESIKNGNKNVEMIFNYEVYAYFLEHILSVKNYKKIDEMLDYIIINEIENSFQIKGEYSYILVYSYNHIAKNNNLGDKKNKMLKSIINHADNLKYKSVTDEKSKKLQFKYIHDLFHCIINLKDEYGIKVLKEILISHSTYYFVSRNDENNNLLMYVNFCIIAYLYYLSIEESEKLVNLTDKNYYKELASEITKHYNDNAVIYNEKFNIYTFLNYLSIESTSWEKYERKEFSVSSKTPKVEKMIKLIKQLFVIIFNNTNYRKITDEDLIIFQYSLINNKLNLKDIEKMIKCSDFFGLRINEEDINSYINKLLKFANEKKDLIIDDNGALDFDKQIDKLNIKLNKEIGLMKIFNSSSDFIGDIIKESRDIITEERLAYLILSGKYEYLNIVQTLENSIIEKINNTRIQDVKFQKNIDNNYLNEFNRNKIYISPENDYWQEEYKYGKEYIGFKKKFKKNIHFKLYDERFILNEFKCKFIKYNITKQIISNKLLNEKIKDFKKNNAYVVKDINGFELNLTKDEFKKYYLSKYVYYKLDYEYKIFVSRDDNYHIIEKK